ncbi:hypothetical protein AUEXF2481DRAFT_3103 [Aureobasidium subglaciale EXF-2481]|uniref:Uncharacterized protein n=1 Tax=Aureobasidium subglaciale (strain EXF-2481) TaxID=1043005 RepID=A0A074YHT0_AURSE|nr:uncharacterized protein AUEXF2481DRAFT_3103 [Aureobasidium subglaciale EXF-2481]KAI5205960.1 hypothetical protein E4T38_03989 [Aureobasidium subglaciale]KAI5224893.1 hypothetical protein E4T40_03764 [Aureobasidium subglaciale]KAI5228014.1 hypothetical protein E4T41_03984 [Aureobasidium subglaciale]KAI5263497.1 hypothetical protein E4T46_03605 [Aureobasidium subglaciale]KEQ97270.1 hypothetical protein AUEXF2481DRAFT_3103 [Aureobasidium subglaciale EXF-2481]
MAHNFAPYQSSPPESTRALSPPLRTSTSSPRPAVVTPRAQASIEDPWAATRDSQLPLPSPSAYDDLEAADTNQSSRLRGDGYYVFETSLGIRMDIEACLPYLLLPPAGGVAMLIFERKSDYVRFHAWQSSLVFTAVFILHLLLSWSRFLSWLLFIGDLALIVLLVFRAYRDAETLDRFELPFFGPLASTYVDRE